MIPKVPGKGRRKINERTTPTNPLVRSHLLARRAVRCRAILAQETGPPGIRATRSRLVGLGGNGPPCDAAVDGTIVRVSGARSSGGRKRPRAAGDDLAAPPAKRTDSRRAPRRVSATKPFTAARRSPGSATRPCRGSSPGAHRGRSRRSSGRGGRGCCSRGGAR